MTPLILTLCLLRGADTEMTVDLAYQEPREARMVIVEADERPRLRDGDAGHHAGNRRRVLWQQRVDLPPAVPCAVTVRPGADRTTSTCRRRCCGR